MPPTEEGYIGGLIGTNNMNGQTGHVAAGSHQHFYTLISDLLVKTHLRSI